MGGMLKEKDGFSIENVENDQGGCFYWSILGGFGVNTYTNFTHVC